MNLRRAVLLAVFVSLTATRAFAQADPNGPSLEQARVKLGPVTMNPQVQIGNVGVDENVFNEALNPKRDFTLTVSPKTEFWMRFMGTWFNGAMNEDIVWYQEYASERMSNSTRRLAWKLPLTRLTADLSTTRLHTRDRAGYEIDARADRSLASYNAGVSYKLLLNTGVNFSANTNSTEYDETVTFNLDGHGTCAAGEKNCVRIRDELNLDASSWTVGLTHQITPLTSLTLGVTRSHADYAFQPVRDSDTTDVTAAIKFDRLAVVKGGATVGFTSFQPRSNLLPGYNGLTLAADLTYTLLGTTKFIFRADRAVQNSFDISQPYYVQTGFFLEVAQQVWGRIDVVGRVGLENLDYRNQVGAVVEVADRQDRVVTYGFGVGYHMGRNLRFGLDFDRTQRSSPLETREYERPKIGTSMTYDF